MNRIQTEARLLDESETGKVGTYLVSFVNDAATTYRLDSGMEALVD